MRATVDRIRTWDERITAGFSKLPQVWPLDIFFGFFSLVGQGGLVWFILAYRLQQTTRMDELFLVLVTAQTLQFIVVGMGIKAAVRRMRPGVAKVALPLWKGWGDYSFPSGHAASSATAWVVISHFVPGALLRTLIVAILCGLSRLYLHKHYRLDMTKHNQPYPHKELYQSWYLFHIILQKMYPL